MRRLSPLLPLAFSLATLALPLAAQAQSVRVKCDVRTDRSAVASVDGRNLPAGDYTAVLTSGANTATTEAQAAVAGEAQFDFSSKPRDIAAGATAISRTFIQGGMVTGMLYNAAGQLVASADRACRVS